MGKYQRSNRFDYCMAEHEQVPGPGGRGGELDGNCGDGSFPNH